MDLLLSLYKVPDEHYGLILILALCLQPYHPECTRSHLNLALCTLSLLHIISYYKFVYSLNPVELQRAAY
jgi:hypothetical protein